MSVRIGSRVTWIETPPPDGRRVSRIICTDEAFSRYAKRDNRSAYETYMEEGAPVARKMLGREVGDSFEVETGVGTKTIKIVRIER